MTKKVLKVAVVVLAILAIPLGAYCVVLHLRIADDVAAQRNAFHAVHESTQGITVSEACGLEFYCDDSYQDNSEFDPPVIVVGRAFSRRSTTGEEYFAQWGITSPSDDSRIDATSFQPGPVDTYLGQMAGTLPLGEHRQRFNNATRAEKVVMTIARDAAAQDDGWAIVQYRSVGDGAVVTLRHSQGIVTLILTRDPGDTERYRLAQTVGSFMGVDPSGSRFVKPKE